MGPSMSLANLCRKLFGPSSQEIELREDFEKVFKSNIKQSNEVIRLMGILYRPNERIVDIRHPLLDAITACQGEPLKQTDIATGEEVFFGLGPPNIGKVQKKIELALEACQKAIKEQTRGVEEVSHGSEET